jgi:hypothetical protein
MFRPIVVCLVTFSIASAIVPTLGTTGSARAEHPLHRARRGVVVTRSRPVYAAQPGPLGTFMPTPAVVIRGNDPVGGGYSPLGIYGDQTMSLYGPFSPFRSATAPVTVYSRGYDGVVRPTEGVSASYPNLPILSPVAYPTQANNYYGPRVVEDPRSSSAINWLDQN